MNDKAGTKRMRTGVHWGVGGGPGGGKVGVSKLELAPLSVRAAADGSSLLAHERLFEDVLLETALLQRENLAASSGDTRPSERMVL